ncbi:MAG: PilZ domain-containing protein [Nitrospirota bacterium]
MDIEGKEKRRYERHAVNGVHGDILCPSDLDILNISIEGAAIETTKRLNLNREYTFRLRHKNSTINLKGRVVWAVLTSKSKKGTEETKPVYRAGIKFIDTLSEKTTMLINFIEENRATKVDKRLTGVRFKIYAPQSAEIEYPYKCDIKKISLSGMLIETQQNFEINSNYDMKLFIDANILNVVGRIANCQEITRDKDILYNIGIEFIKISDKDRELLKNFLEGM